MKRLSVILVLFNLSACATWFESSKESQIQKVVTQNNHRLSYCYKKALEHNRELEGQMRLSWVVDYRSGQERVREVSVEDTDVNSSILAECMKRAVSGMRFDLKDRHEVRVQKVSYPFYFSNDKHTSLRE